MDKQKKTPTYQGRAQTSKQDQVPVPHTRLPEISVAHGLSTRSEPQSPKGLIATQAAGSTPTPSF